MPINFEEMLAEYFSGIKRKKARHRCIKRGESWNSYCNKFAQKSFEELIMNPNSLISSLGKSEWVSGKGIKLPFTLRKRSYLYRNN